VAEAAVVAEEEKEMTEKIIETIVVVGSVLNVVVAIVV